MCLSVVWASMATVMQTVRMRGDALRQMMISEELCSVLDPRVDVPGATDWPSCYAEAMEALAIASDHAGRIFESPEEAEARLFSLVEGFEIRGLLREKLLSMLEPVEPTVMQSRRFPRTTRDQDRASAVAAAVFAATHPDLIARQRARIVDGSIWLMTERTPGEKYKTRYRSEGAKDVHDGRLLAHEHVIQRKGLIARILATTSPLGIREILDEAVGCTVLRSEHGALGADKHVDGWQRYKNAGITVYDCGEDGTEAPRRVPWTLLGIPDE